MRGTVLRFISVIVAAAGVVTATAGTAQALPEPGLGQLPSVSVAIASAAAVAPAPRDTPEYNQWFARTLMADRYGWGDEQFACLRPMWIGESHWQRTEETGPYIGIPQTTVGQIEDYGFTESEYRDSAEVQVRVGLRYIKERYGSPCAAWEFWKAQGAWQDSSDPSQWWGGWY